MNIPYGRQDISESDIQSVVDVLNSDFLTQGPAIPAFENSICNYTGSQYAVAVNSATSALHLACRALGLTKGDIIWTSPITFVASANCALYCGAEIDFVDIDPQTYNLCPQQLAQKLELAAQQNKLPKIVIPVHLAGQSCDMKAIYELSKKYGFKIIEDASHAIGGKYLDQPIGNCSYSDICVFSFHPVKIITTGEGGMLTTNNQELAQKMQLLRSHGITRESSLMTHEPDGPWYYQQIDLGYNYRMTDIQAALGLSQMQKLDEFIVARHKIAQKYNEDLAELPVILPHQNSDTHSSFHLYIVRMKGEKLSKSHRQIFEQLRDKGIGVNLHYIPVHLQPYYQKMGFKKGSYPESEHYYSNAISIPMYATLTNEQQNYVINTLKEVLQ